MGLDEGGKVVDVDDDFCGLRFDEPLDGEVEQGAPFYFYKGFRQMVGEGAQACAEACGEDEGFH